MVHDGKSATAESISAYFDHCKVITELGTRPSDLLQANGVLWVEGPSDRIYLNRFIELFSDSALREGRDYQCAFYGGSVLAKTQFASPDEGDAELTNLLRLNTNVAIICDGDRTALRGKGAELKLRVKRVQAEVAQIPHGKLWITEAKEIENYIPGQVWGKVYGVDSVRDPNQFDRFPSKDLDETTFVRDALKRASFDKVEFAMEAAPLLTKDLLITRFDLNREMIGLIETIKLWNK